jgi:hypothetical protein
MADGRPAHRRSRAWLVVAAIVALGVAMPVVVLAGDVRPEAPSGIDAPVDRPGESCPDETAAPGDTGRVCIDANAPQGSGGGGGLDVGLLLPVLLVAVAGAAIALVAAYLVLRRRASAPFAPSEPGEWWTCAKCGKANVAGSPRCFACGTWHA